MFDSRSSSTVLLIILVISVLLFILINPGMSGNTILAREVNNIGHFPFFGILSLLILVLLSRFFSDRISNRLSFYYMAFSVTIFIGILHEYSQIFGPRDADVRDLLRDAAGALTFLGIRAIFDKKLAAFWKKRGTVFKKVVFFVACLICISVILPVAKWGAAYFNRQRVFPQICGFESVWEIMFLKTQDAKLETVLLPEKWAGKPNDHAGKMTFFVARYPGLAIEEPYPDWTGYKLLTFMVFSELDHPVRISIRIEDSQHNNAFEDRYTGSFIIVPGSNKISIPLEEIRNAPAGRQMDMTTVRGILIFASAPSERFSLYFDNIRLE